LKSVNFLGHFSATKNQEVAFAFLRAQKFCVTRLGKLHECLIATQCCNSGYQARHRDRRANV